MQLVINIDEVIYKRILPYKDVPVISNLANDFPELIHAVANGVPLPKGHKVIDAFALQEHLALVPMEDRTYREAVEIIDKFPPITETDEGVEE